MTETPSTVHGRLLESLHISGYSFNRACDELEWLLEDDRWKQCGTGFSDFGTFAETIRLALPKFDEAAGLRRKKLAKRFTELGASQRETAKALGVGKTTIQEDLTGRKHSAQPVVYARETAVLRVVESKMPDEEIRRSQREVLPIFAALIDLGIDAGVIRERSGVYVVEGKPRWVDGARVGRVEPGRSPALGLTFSEHRQLTQEQLATFIRCRVAARLAA